MIRGTTAQFNFKLPCEVNQLKWVKVKFWQSGYNGPILAPLPIYKIFNAPIESDNPSEISVILTPEETARFSDKFKAKVQLRAERIDGSKFGSNREDVTVYPMEDDMIEEIPENPTVNEEGWFILDGMRISDGGDD